MTIDLDMCPDPTIMIPQCQIIPQKQTKGQVGHAARSNVLSLIQNQLLGQVAIQFPLKVLKDTDSQLDANLVLMQNLMHKV